jgi:hypothetical protein
VIAGSPSTITDVEVSERLDRSWMDTMACSKDQEDGTTAAPLVCRRWHDGVRVVNFRVPLAYPVGSLEYDCRCMKRQTVDSTLQLPMLSPETINLRIVCLTRCRCSEGQRKTPYPVVVVLEVRICAGGVRGFEAERSTNITSTTCSHG